MTIVAASARLSRMTQSTLDPVLSSDDLVDLLGYAAISDTSGRVPSNLNWTPTYSETYLFKSAQEGWLLKAGKLNGETFISDGASFHPESFRDFCVAQAETYGKKVVGSARLRSRTSVFESTIPSNTVAN